jgi:hypothetical protein
MALHEIIGTSFLMVSEGFLDEMWERNATIGTNWLKRLVVSEVDSPSGGSIVHKTSHWWWVHAYSTFIASRFRTLSCIRPRRFALRARWVWTPSIGAFCHFTLCCASGYSGVLDCRTIGPCKMGHWSSCWWVQSSEGDADVGDQKPLPLLIRPQVNEPASSSEGGWILDSGCRTHRGGRLLGDRCSCAVEESILRPINPWKSYVWENMFIITVIYWISRSPSFYSGSNPISKPSIKQTKSQNF